jgi:hypothetical protein
MFIILTMTWGFFSNANLIMSGGNDAIDFFNLIVNYLTELLLGVLLMGYAMKMPFLTRFFQRVLESVPKNTRGYLLIRYLHSNYVKELPNVFLLFFGTISNLIGLFAGFLEINKIFDGQNWWRGLFFWLPLWFGIFGQVLTSLGMLIYPFIFCGFLGISIIKKNDPDEEMVPPVGQVSEIEKEEPSVLDETKEEQVQVVDEIQEEPVQDSTSYLEEVNEIEQVEVHESVQVEPEEFKEVDMNSIVEPRLEEEVLEGQIE